MFRPLILYIGLRYTRAKQRSHFVSFISLTSMLGIALGVTVLITVLSIMNGFDHEIRNRIFGLSRQVAVSTSNNILPDWHNLMSELVHYPGVKSVAPNINGQGMLTYGNQVRPTLVTGIIPKNEVTVSKINSKIIAGSFKNLQQGSFGIVLGQKLAQSLGLSLYDKVTLVIPEALVTPVGIMPRSKRFILVGIFKAGTGFGFDSDLAFINLYDAQKLFHMGSAISLLRLKLFNLYDAPKVSEQLTKTLNKNYRVTNWTQDYGEFFNAIKLEKTMMFIMLLLIIAVAAFNLVATLVMVVTDKRSDIAILRTFGATPRDILGIFMVQGSIIGLIGTLLGLVAGVTLALNVSAIESAIENYFQLQLFSSDIYYVNYLPSQLHWQDVWQICLAALGMSLLATIYPAWRASRTEPAEALRYE